tara:strand:+ start:1202 stop:1423 length:222 start_codon:yes stop_codon:yes gene_type:complete
MGGIAIGMARGIVTEADLEKIMVVEGMRGAVVIAAGETAEIGKEIEEDMVGEMKMDIDTREEKEIGMEIERGM